MIDLHSHIIPCVDDGSASLEESIALINEAKKAGFKGIFLTSHYIHNDNYISTPEERDLLRAKLDEYNLGVKLYSGAEIFVIPEIKSLLINGNVQTLNKSKYVLIELPLNQKITRLKDIIYDILSLHLIPIIAHPERYSFVQEDPNTLLELLEMGALMQSNYASIIGFYGKSAQNTVKILLKHNMIHFFGTDTHRANTIYPQINTIKAELIKIIGKEKFIELSETNPKCVVEDDCISVEEPLTYRKKLFGIF